MATLSGRPLRRCQVCGHGFLELPHPETIDVVYDDHYAGYRDDPIFRRAAAAVLTEHILPRSPLPARLLDVGCGNGEFLAIARDAGYTVDGIDVSLTAQELCRRRGIDVRVGDLRSPGTFSADERFDLITFWDVIEHLPDPRGFLARARDLLRPDGQILVKTPSTSEATLRLSAAVPRLAVAFLQAPSHVQYFDRDGLGRLLGAAGFVDLHWIAIRGMRSSVGTGSVRRRLTRWVIRRAHEAAGDGNLLVLGRRS